MDNDNPIDWSISEVSNAYRSGGVTPLEILALVSNRIDQFDSQLKSFVTRTPEIAELQARRATDEISKGIDRGPLHGIPISLKDLIDVKGVRATGGSRLHKDRVPSQSASVAIALENAGAVLLGKNSTYEFGLGLPMSGDWPEPAHNPWDLNRIPGGSSSGSAAAVFAGLSFGAFGTDTGGSIRGPAAYCGVVGLKPTFGLIDTGGVLPLSDTLDHLGPIGRKIADVRALLIGAVPDFTSVAVSESLVGVRFGVPWDLIEQAAFGPGVVESFESSVGLLESAGAKIGPVELPPNATTEQALLAIIGHESYAHHKETLESQPAAYGASAFERLSAGRMVSDEDLERAFDTRKDTIKHMAGVFDTVDWIVSPVTHTTAATFVDYEAKPTPRTLFTGIFNLIGAPALSMPSGLDASHMPIGIQIAGPRHSENGLFNVTEAIESLIQFPPALSKSAASLRSS